MRANGRQVVYGYGSAGSADDVLGRVATIGDGTTTYAAYRYLGARTIIGEDYQQAQVELDHAGNNFAGLDQFGRIVDQVWTSYGQNPGVLDDYTYAYDRAGNRTSRANVLDAALSQLYEYDAVNQLTSFTRTGGAGQSWDLDSLGNWLGFTEGGVTESKTFNAANEATSSSSEVTPAYDAAGNATVTAKPGSPTTGLACTFDAWNRLVAASDGTTTVEYRYDGRGRRTQRIAGETAERYYYCDHKVIETRLPDGQGGQEPNCQYVWSLSYIDAPILHDTYSGGVVMSSARLYYLTDANHNVTAVTDSAGLVLERYDYDPYGMVTIYDATWANVLGASTVGNTRLFAGQEIDPATGLYHARARWYSPQTGRFLGRDPSGFAAGDMNLYRYCGNNPALHTDPTGLEEEGGWVDDDQGYYERPSWLPEDGASPWEGWTIVDGHLVSADGNTILGWDWWDPASGPVDAPMTAPAEEIAAANLANDANMPTDWLANAANLAAGFGDTVSAGLTDHLRDWLGINDSVDYNSGFYQAGQVAGEVENIALSLVDPCKAGGALATGGLQLINALQAAGNAVDAIEHAEDGEYLDAALDALSAYGHLSNAMAPICFVAGTPVLVPGDREANEAVGDRAAMAEEGTDEAWVLAGLCVLVSLSGLYADKRRSRRKRQQEPDSVDLLWAEGDEENVPAGRHVYGDRMMITDRFMNSLMDQAQQSRQLGSTSVDDWPAVEDRSRIGLSVVGRNRAADLSAAPPGRKKDVSMRMDSGARSGSQATRSTSSGKAETIRSRFGRRWLIGCLALAAIFAGSGTLFRSPQSHVQRHATIVSSAQHTSRNIENIRVGQRVVTDGSRNVGSTAVDPATWRKFVLRAKWRWADGTLDDINVETLQPPEWIAAQRATVGAVVSLPLDLVEMGLPDTLRAKVLSVEPCPRIQKAPGRVVVTTVNHLNPYVLDVTLADAHGRYESVRPTGFHKFYSATRGQWVSAEHLQPGEELRGITGPVKVLRVGRLPRVHRVYNMTVEAEHVYRVSFLGLLAHNNQCRNDGRIIDDTGKSEQDLTTAMNQGDQGRIDAAQEQLDGIQQAQAGYHRDGHGFRNDPDTWDENEPLIPGINCPSPPKK